jgi:PPM family protein phosphatase
VGSSESYVWELARASVEFDVSSATDRGRIRAANEDSLVASPPVFLVADGMGGHAFGDRASQAAARVFSGELAIEQPSNSEAVLRAITLANAEVLTIASPDDFAGTTLAGVILVNDVGAAGMHWMVINIGDSRVYRWNGAALEQLSVDHSAVQELVDSGEISVAESVAHPDRNVITRALGIDEVVDADVWLLPAEGTSHFIICSDGLTKELDDASIAALLSVADAQDSIAARLVAAALAAGGRDNVTVVSVSATVTVTPSMSGGIASVVPQHLEETHPRR